MTTGKRGKMEDTRLRTATADMVEPEHPVLLEYVS